MNVVKGNSLWGYHTTNMGGVVAWNTGTVENCTAETTTIFTASDYPGGNVSIGGVVGQNYGAVKNCE